MKQNIMANPGVSQTGEDLGVFVENRSSREVFWLTGCLRMNSDGLKTVVAGQAYRSFAGVKITYLKAFN